MRLPWPVRTRIATRNNTESSGINETERDPAGTPRTPNLQVRGCFEKVENRREAKHLERQVLVRVQMGEHKKPATSASRWRAFWLSGQFRPDRLLSDYKRGTTFPSTNWSRAFLASGPTVHRSDPRRSRSAEGNLACAAPSARDAGRAYPPRSREGQWCPGGHLGSLGSLSRTTRTRPLPRSSRLTDRRVHEPGCSFKGCRDGFGRGAIDRCSRV
ncbi:hypothetical protein DFR71_5418 [Nocardia alba]|uniref:Uncharacterized protein n=1 Tax=Nocardia alba TaxID=225051 RepID=A0A4R1FMV7_9NOCA|nr:hypothetical protein DFR71_5418 [Nocardia alba]